MARLKTSLKVLPIVTSSPPVGTIPRTIRRVELNIVPILMMFEKHRKSMPTIAAASLARLVKKWVDGALEAQIHEVLKNGGRVRIVARKSTDKSVLDAVNRLKRSGAKIKTNNMVHARVLVAEDECIVGSADLKSDSLDLNREAGVYTTDPVIVLSVKDFFEKLWMDEESVDLK